MLSYGNTSICRIDIFFRNLHDKIKKIFSPLLFLSKSVSISFIYFYFVIHCRVRLIKTCHIFHIISNLQLGYCLPEDDVSRILTSNRLKCCMMHCGNAGCCHWFAVWWSAYILFNERTFRRDFQIQNVMCMFMDKYFFPDY